MSTNLVPLLPELFVLFYESQLLLLKLLTLLPQTLVKLQHALVARASHLQLQFIVLIQGKTK